MKKRLDIYLVEKGYFDTRQKAISHILLGNVILNGEKITKAGTLINEEKVKEVYIKEKLKYVSRGGLKLEGAIKHFKIDFCDKIVLDIGASTGGFTDCALQHKAKFVYALDVGKDQLDYRLRQNSKIKSIEQTHIKELKKEEILEKVDIVVVDVSFISLDKILPEIKRLDKEGVLNTFYSMILLIKPQFELQKELIGKNGIVDKEENREIAVKKIKDLVKKEYQIMGLIPSPIKGAKGNVEYLIYLTKKEVL